MSSSKFVLAAAALAVVGMLSAAPVRADDATTEAAYTENHFALTVAKLCLGLTYGQDVGFKINQKIIANAGMPMPGRALTLIRVARADAQKLVDSKGCSSAPAQAALAKFNADIAPAMQ